MNNSSTKATNKTNAKATTNKEVVTVMKDYLKELQEMKNACISKVVEIYKSRIAKNRAPQAKDEETTKVLESLKACNIQNFIEVSSYATPSNVLTVETIVTWYATHKKALQQIVDKKNHTNEEKHELIVAYVNNRIAEKSEAYKHARALSISCKLLSTVK